MTRRYAWRTHRCYGAHLLDQEFDTATDAGCWRKDNFPDPDGAPLTLVALEGGQRSILTASEMAAAHWAWLSPDQNETAAGGSEPRTAA